MTAIVMLFITGTLLLAAEVMLPGAIAGIIGGAALLGASVLAFMEFGAAVGSIAATFRKYPGIGTLLPAVGYGEKQMNELKQTIDKVDCDLVLIATPIDLRRAIHFEKPALRVTYELQEIGKPDLDDVLAKLP